MALLNEDNRYIKLSIGGKYEVYPSLEKRNLVKNSTNQEVIINKYETLQLEYYNELLDYAKKINLTEAVFNDKVKFNALLKNDSKLKTLFDRCNNINLEYNNYRYAVSYHNKTLYDYPIMSTIYKDIKNSIPEIIESGIIELNGTSYEQLYEDAKSKLRFGKTSDV